MEVDRGRGAVGSRTLWRLRFRINGMFSAASLLTGPESRRLNPNGPAGWRKS